MEKEIKFWLKRIKENETVISMLLGGLVVVIAGILLINYFRQGQSRAQITDTSEATASAEYTRKATENRETTELIPDNLPDTHTVSQGEYLWAIAEKYYGSGFNWVDIASENKLTNADMLLAGTQLVLPKVRIRTPAGQLQVQASARQKIESAATYTVKANDSLWSIADTLYQDGYKWVDIYNANKDMIADPGTIEIGWVFTVPKV